MITGADLHIVPLPESNLLRSDAVTKRWQAPALQGDALFERTVYSKIKRRPT
jgi:hypothetical protein